MRYLKAFTLGPQMLHFSSMEKLPPVAKNFYHPCSKCDADRYHRVLAHTSMTEAKLECEVCGSKKKYKLGKAVATTKKKTTRRKKSAATHEQAWQELKDKYSDLPPEVYSVKGSFQTDSLIDHPTFGIGVVTESHTRKIEVCFQEGMKTLMHRREL